MANAKVKTEMKGDTSRWTTRADAKQSANRRRRAEDRTVNDDRPRVAQARTTGPTFTLSKTPPDGCTRFIVVPLESLKERRCFSFCRQERADTAEEALAIVMRYDDMREMLATRGVVPDGWYVGRFEEDGIKDHRWFDVEGNPVTMADRVAILSESSWEYDAMGKLYATKPHTVDATIDGKRVSVAVCTGDTENTIGQAIVRAWKSREKR